MNREYLEWINRTYKELVDNPRIIKVKLTIPDGEILVYRVEDVICFDIKLGETRRK